jgi:hypothetical protein
VDGGDSGGECERDVVSLIALMTNARGDGDGAEVGRANLNGEGDPISDDDGVPLRFGFPNSQAGPSTSLVGRRRRGT